MTASNAIITEIRFLGGMKRKRSVPGGNLRATECTNCGSTDHTRFWVLFESKNDFSQLAVPVPKYGKQFL